MAHIEEHSASRRDFLYVATGAAGAVAAGAAIWPLVNQMNPSADVQALASIRVDVSAVPEGTQTGKTFRLKGKGIKNVRSGYTGDLFCHVAVETPVNLTSRQRDLLREFEAAGADNHPETQDFFGRVKSFWDGMKG